MLRQFHIETSGNNEYRHCRLLTVASRKLNPPCTYVCFLFKDGASYSKTVANILFPSDPYLRVAIRDDVRDFNSFTINKCGRLWLILALSPLPARSNGSPTRNNINIERVSVFTQFVSSMS